MAWCKNQFSALQLASA